MSQTNEFLKRHEQFFSPQFRIKLYNMCICVCVSSTLVFLCRSSRLVLDNKSGSATSTSCSACQYYTNNDPYSYFIDLPPTNYHHSNLQVVNYRNISSICKFCLGEYRRKSFLSRKIIYPHIYTIRGF